MSRRTVWLASYPKSGNTWFRAVYSALAGGGKIDINNLGDGPQAADSVLFERRIGISPQLLSTSEIELLRPRVDEALDREGPDMLLRKVHDLLHVGPSGELIVSGAATRCAIYILRDPRDVAVSFAHHLNRPVEQASRLISGRPRSTSDRWGDPDEEDPRLWYRLTAPNLPQHLGGWSDHVRSWIDEAPFAVHTLRYEDCLRSPVPTFLQALRSGGMDVTEERVRRAVEAASFERLRSQEQQAGFAGRVGRSAFFRRGRIGSWRDELPGGEARLIEEEHAEVMTRFGYL